MRNRTAGRGSPRRRGYRLGVVAVGVVCAAVAGCGGGKPASSPAPATSAVPTTASASPSTTMAVPAYDPARNARPEVKAGVCAGGASTGWSLSGTVTNASTGTRGYSIVVDFITVPGDTVVATRVVTVPPLEPRASAKWTAAGPGPGSDHLTCVIRQSLST
jgi:hypothetical protein